MFDIYGFITILIWRPPDLCELTPIISNIELTNLGSESSNYCKLYILLCATIMKVNFLITKWSLHIKQNNLRLTIMIIFLWFTIDNSFILDNKKNGFNPTSSRVQ